MTVYTLSQVTKSYDGRTVLDIDALAIEEGHIYALLGPNGAGKTTLLKILGFLDSPTTGNVRYQSSPVIFSEYFLHRLRKQVVMVNQHPILFTTTVYKNLEFGLKIRKIQKKKRVHLINEALDLVGMGHMIDAPAHKLSGGETQRVALARAAALSPEVILFDEPTSNVDLENQAVIINLLRQINEERKITLIFTSHDKHQAALLAHDTLFLDHGKLTTASYENLFTATLTPKANGFARCVIKNNLTLTIPSSRTGTVRLLIDPEHIDIVGNGSNNCLRGRVVQVVEEKGKIRVGVDGGIYITLLLSQEKYKKRPPMVGEAACLSIDPKAVRII